MVYEYIQKMIPNTRLRNAGYDMAISATAWLCSKGFNEFAGNVLQETGELLVKARALINTNQSEAVDQLFANVSTLHKFVEVANYATFGLLAFALISFSVFTYNMVRFSQETSQNAKSS